MTSFKIHPALPNIVYVNLGSDPLEIYFNPEMEITNDVSGFDAMFGVKFTPATYDGKVIAFGYWKDAWTGPGDTREIGIWSFLDEELRASAVINKNTAELKNGYYTVYLDTPLEILFGVEYVLGNLYKEGDKQLISAPTGSILKDRNILYLQSIANLEDTVFQFPTGDLPEDTNFGPGTAIYTLEPPGYSSIT
jgi:hypothetical protein